MKIHLLKILAEGRSAMFKTTEEEDIRLYVVVQDVIQLVRVVNLHVAPPPEEEEEPHPPPGKGGIGYG